MKENNITLIVVEPDRKFIMFLMNNSNIFMKGSCIQKHMINSINIISNSLTLDAFYW